MCVFPEKLAHVSLNARRICSLRYLRERHDGDGEKLLIFLFLGICFGKNCWETDVKKKKTIICSILSDNKRLVTRVLNMKKNVYPSPSKVTGGTQAVAVNLRDCSCWKIQWWTRTRHEQRGTANRTGAKICEKEDQSPCSLLMQAAAPLVPPAGVANQDPPWRRLNRSIQEKYVDDFIFEICGHKVSLRQGDVSRIEEVGFTVWDGVSYINSGSDLLC
jgi:hypothetical protein